MLRERKQSHSPRGGLRRPRPPPFLDGRIDDDPSSRNLADNDGPASDEDPFVTLGCMLIPVAVVIWWFWSRGCGRKPSSAETTTTTASIDGRLLTIDDNATAASSSNDSRTTTRGRPTSSDDLLDEEASGYEIMDCRTDSAALAMSSAVLHDPPPARTTMRRLSTNIMERITVSAKAQRKERSKLRSPREALTVQAV
jgi:hypothetical protein